MARSKKRCGPLAPAEASLRRVGLRRDQLEQVRSTDICAPHLPAEALGRYSNLSTTGVTVRSMRMRKRFMQKGRDEPLAMAC